MRLGGPESVWTLQIREKSCTSRNWTWTIQPITQHYTYWAILSPITFHNEYKLWSSALCNFLQFPIISSLLCINILLGTLPSNTLSLHSSLTATNQVSHPHKTRSKIIALQVLIFTFPNNIWETKIILNSMVLSYCSQTIKHKAIYRFCMHVMESYIAMKKRPLLTVAYFSKMY